MRHRRLIHAVLAAAALPLLAACAARGAATATAGATPAAAPAGAEAAVPAAAPAAAPARANAPIGERPVVAIMNSSFYGKSANSIEAGDPEMAHVATARIRQVVREANALTVVDSARVAALAEQHQQVGRACNTSIDCARRVGVAAGARWVVMSKVSKTSNLIWYFSGQVIDVATGKLLMDDEFELKGQRDEMILLGARSLGRRVVRVTERALAGGTPAGAP